MNSQVITSRYATVGTSTASGRTASTDSSFILTIYYAMSRANTLKNNISDRFIKGNEGIQSDLMGLVEIRGFDYYYLMEGADPTEWKDSITSSLRVNADNYNKKSVLAFWAVFASLLVVVFVTSNYTPYTFIFKSNRGELADTHHRDCSNPVSFDNKILVCQDFSIRNPKLGLIMRNLSPLNQFAQINLVILPLNQSKGTIEVKQGLSIELMSLKRIRVQVGEDKTMIGFQKGEDVKVISDLQFDTRTYSLQDVVSDEGRVQAGYEINLGYYREFKTSDALLVATFSNFDQKLYQNYQLVLTAILMNDNYTKFIMIMRGVFLSIMVLSTIFFLNRIKYINRSPSIPEQTIVIVLSICTILFNDPYYFIGVFKPNLVSIFIQTLFVAIFFIVLLWSWVHMLEKINCESRGRQYALTSCRRWIYTIIGLDYFCILFAFNYEIGYYAYKDSPIVPLHKNFFVIQIVTVIFFGGLFLYIFYLYARLSMIWRDIIWRNKLYVTFNIFFVGLLVMFISLGWFSLYDESSQKFQILYASMNIYVLYMQYMYSHPSQQEEQKLNEEFQEVQTVSTITIDDFNDNTAVIDLDRSYSAHPTDLKKELDSQLQQQQ